MNGRRIFIVEDEGITAMALQESLEGLGYEVSGIAASGEEAIERMRADKPDLVLMDIVLQGQMDGIDAAAIIHREMQIPVVFLSAHADKATLERARMAQPFGYIVKPYTDDELKSNLEIALYKHGMEQKVLENREELRFIADSVRDAIIAADAQGMILFWNKGAEALFGYTEDEVLRQPLTMLMAERFRALHNEGLRRARESGKSRLSDQIIELEAVRKSGDVFPMEMSLSTWLRAEKRFFGGVIRDISERKHLEEREQFAAFQSGVAEMSVTILHNIGNAIMGIAHRSENMQAASDELEKVAAALSGMRQVVAGKRQADITDAETLDALAEVIEGVGKRLQHLADNVFGNQARIINQGVTHISEMIELHQDAARPQIQSTRFDLGKLLENAVAIQAESLEKYGVTTEIRITPEARDLTMPRSQLMQLLINLIKNGKEAIQRRHATDPVPGRIQVEAHRHNDWLELRVADNGCGIPAEHLESIFGYGFTTREGGTGFGLHSAANFVQSLNGTIQAVSAGVNQGAELRVVFPGVYADPQP